MSDIGAEIKEIEKAVNNMCVDWVGIGVQLNSARQALLELKRLASIEAPTEIVRCKDCVYRRDDHCDNVDYWIKDDDFCSRGENERSWRT